MIVAWMIYAAFVATLVALAARAAEALGRLAGVAVRWVWAGALALTMLLVAIAPLRSRSAAELPRDVTYVESSPNRDDATDRASWIDASRAALDAARRALTSPVTLAIEAARRELPARASDYAAYAWLSLSASLLLLLAAVYARLRRERRTWPDTELHDVRVRVAPNTGPAVIGIVRPDIVVPRWLLLRPPGEQRLALAHERQHVLARDPLLLAAGCVVVALFPWHPAVWWMLSRLRLTMELDCDARVLRAGATPRSYGALLIDVAEHRSGLRLGAPALADGSTHLRQRLIAMTTDRRRFAITRGSAIAAIALVAIIAACEAPLPTAAEVQNMKTADAERAVVRLAMMPDTSLSIKYLVDGAETTAEQARALRADEIAGMEVVKATDGGQSEIRVATVKAEEVALSGRRAVERRSLLGLRLDRSLAAGDTIGPVRTSAGFTGLIVIDGVRATQRQLREIELRKSSIESIEVLKGAAAARQYSEPEAANGVIVVKTKQPGAARR